MAQEPLMGRVESGAGMNTVGGGEERWEEMMALISPKFNQPHGRTTAVLTSTWSQAITPGPESSEYATWGWPQSSRRIRASPGLCLYKFLVNIDDACVFRGEYVDANTVIC